MPSRPDAVHPWLPRFSQAITGLICLEAGLLRNWPAVGIALVLVLLGLAGPRWSPVGWIFRLVARPPAELEPAAPVRFAQVMAVAMLAAGLVLRVAGAATAGWALVWVVAAVALFSAASGVCVGCELYRLRLRGRHSGDDLRAALGLVGKGPWLVIVTAPGCGRCEPVAREVGRMAGGHELVRVDLMRTPGAADTGIRSVPALLAVGPDGRLREARAGRLGRDDIAPVLAAVGVP